MRGVCTQYSVFSNLSPLPFNHRRIDVNLLGLTLPATDIVMLGKFIVLQGKNTLLDDAALLVHGVVERVHQVGYGSQMFLADTPDCHLSI